MSNSIFCLSERLTVSVDEAMTALGMGKTMMYELLNDGSIRSFKKGKKRFISVQSLHEWVSKNTNETID